jgi:hypothetical protein
VVAAVTTDIKTLPTVVSIQRICAHGSRDQAQSAGMACLFPHPGRRRLSAPIIVVRMHPSVRRDLALFGQLDQVHGRQYRRVGHERHFSAASSFQIGVLRGRRIASSGRLTRVWQRLHMTSSQP